MTKKQAELIGVFSAIPAKAIDTYYLDKFNNVFTTIGETIQYDELGTELISLGIIRRGTELPKIKVDGFTRNSVTPDIIGGKSTFTTNDLLQLQPGQVETVVNGQIVNNYQAIVDRHLTKLKIGYLNTATTMAAEVFLKGKCKLPDSNAVIDYGYTEPTEKTFKKKEIDWTKFVLELVEEYRKENKIYPTTIEVDSEIFKEMIQNDVFRDQVKAFNHGNLKTSNGRPAQPVINILGYDVKSLVPAVDSDGKEIDTKNLIYVSSNVEFVKGYTGIPYAEDNKLKIFSGEYFVDEITKKDPDSVSIGLQSGFVPIIPIAKRVMRYKLTLS